MQWLLIVASALTIRLTVKHIQNNKILVLVSDVAATFKSSMSAVLICLYEFPSN